MRSPQDEQAALLHEAIRRATDELKAPIERIEIVGDRVDCWSKSRQVSLAFSFSQPGYFASNRNFDTPLQDCFVPYAGGGSWDLWVIKSPNAVPEALKTPIRKILERRVFIMGSIAIVSGGLIVAAMNRISRSKPDANICVRSSTLVLRNNPFRRAYSESRFKHRKSGSRSG